MRAYIEGYGCSLNKSDTEKIRGFLAENRIPLSLSPEKADCIIINTCAVKQPTETRMLGRIRQLNAIAEKRGSALIVFGCLPKINHEAVSKISKKIVQIGPSLKELASFLQLPKEEFSPLLPEKRENPFVSILPVARGCLGNCSYCTVKNARGNLKSYSIASLNKKFRAVIKEAPEIWLTAQDCGCYGRDLGTNLVELLKLLLENKGNFRVRIGMANPGHILKFLDSYLELFKDERLYRFFHIPVQSGSSQVLSAMNRAYKGEDFLEIAERIRKRFPDAVIATDVIVGFPGETEKQFRETVALLRRVQPDVVNISRFGARPGTRAAEMGGQLHGRELKKRSRLLTKLCKGLSLKRSRLLLGTKQRILVTERGPKGNFVGRSPSYNPVAIRENRLGEFVEVRVKGAFPTYLYAVLAGE